MPLLFLIWPILDARAEILAIISLHFWKIYDATNLFWKYLTFRKLLKNGSSYIQILDMLVDIYFSSIFRLACSQSTGAGLSKTYSKRKGQKHKIRPCKFQLACSSLESQLLATLLSRIKAAQPYHLLLLHGVLVLHSRSCRRRRHWPLTPAAFLTSHSGSKCLNFTSLFSRLFR